MFYVRFRYSKKHTSLICIILYLFFLFFLYFKKHYLLMCIGPSGNRSLPSRERVNPLTELLFALFKQQVTRLHDYPEVESPSTISSKFETRSRMIRVYLRWWPRDMFGIGTEFFFFFVIFFSSIFN